MVRCCFRFFGFKMAAISCLFPNVLLTGPSRKFMAMCGLAHSQLESSSRNFVGGFLRVCTASPFGDVGLPMSDGVHMG